MFYQCNLPHVLEVIFINFQIRNLIHKGMTPSRLPQYVCVFSTNWETVCIYEDWAAVLLQLHVLAHSYVGYVSLHDSIALGGCTHCFSGSIRIKYYASSYLKMHSTFFYVINFFFTFTSEIHTIQFCIYLMDCKSYSYLFSYISTETKEYFLWK